jgi:murein DD-endopeptidase MepM/ murein hydrolase activator NlpD
MKYLGFPYHRTEEINKDTIDCSTLTSQSYWEGAMIRIPFVAENQRASNSGRVIKFEEVKPADIVVKYPNIQAAPDKKYNHVGLFLGRDENNMAYVIESNSKDGCLVNTLENFDPHGGFRQYIRNEGLILNPEIFMSISDLAKSVPKLSRIWSKQYNRIDSSLRYVHKGIDIYVDGDTLVKSPINGTLTFGKLDNEYNNCVIISNEKKEMKCILGNVNIIENIKENTEINIGDVIGKVIESSNKSIIKYHQMNGSNTHLHFEVSGNIKSSYNLYEYELDGIMYYNPLYIAKLDIIKLPV